MLLYILAVLSILLVAIYYLIKRDPDPYLGVYSQPGKWYWLKYALFRVIVTLRRLGLASNAGYGKKARTTLKELDDVQPLSDHPLAIDAAYFNGYNKEGFYFGAGIQRRPEGKVESIFFLRVPGLGIFEWPFVPSTATNEAEPNSYSAQGGLRLQMKIPMKQWRVTFDGQLKHQESGKNVRVKFDFVWNATTEWFDFDTDMHPHLLCDAIAREPWSSEFFAKLRDAHQTHHEQFGLLSGTLSMEGRGDQEVELKSMRDHSYGLYRDWDDFYRYILHYFAFDNGSYLALHLVSLKDTMSHLMTGFYTDENGRKEPVYDCDRRLYTIGEGGKPPEKYQFTVTLEEEKALHVECENVETRVWYCGRNREAKIHVYMCRAVMNGVKGEGMCEFEYFHVGD